MESGAMNIFIKIIPMIEVLLILAMLGLSGFGYRFLPAKKIQPNQNQRRLKWILSGLLGLAGVSITLLLFFCFVDG
jgi:hypothetical protein